jgi:hypothetical protein
MTNGIDGLIVDDHQQFLENRLGDDLGPMGLSISTVICGRKVTARSISQETWTDGKPDVNMFFRPAAEREGGVPCRVRQEFLQAR